MRLLVKLTVLCASLVVHRARRYRGGWPTRRSGGLPASGVGPVTTPAGPDRNGRTVSATRAMWIRLDRQPGSGRWDRNVWGAPRTN
jgi:hypothetical protein